MKQPTTSTLDRRQFSAGVLLPVVLALVVTASAVLGFLFWSTAGIDARALERQSAMFEQVMETRRTRLQRELERVAHSDTAVQKTAVGFDRAWVERHFGVSLFEFFAHDRTIVLDSRAQPLFVMKEGVATETAAYRAMASPIQGIVNRVRALPFVSMPLGAPQVLRAVTDFAVVEGQPAIVSATTIVSDTGELVLPDGRELLLVGVKMLDAKLAAELSRNYLFENGRFSLTGTRNDAWSAHPIFNNAGRFVGFFEWERDRPGLLMLRQTGPAQLIAFLIAVVLVFLLLRQLRRSSAALEDGRRQAERQAAHDALTGLPNRTNFDAQLGCALADRRSGPLALLMLDLDRFKQVNDTLGHEAGDTLIGAVARRLGDVVGPGAVIARLGGDEFAVLLPLRDRSTDATDLAARIIQSIGQPFTLNQFKAYVGASIGIVDVGPGTTEPRELMRKADIALYEAKAGGRNRAVVYEEHMNELLQLQHTIEGELRDALQRDDQLYVVFQPLVDQASRKVIGAEALARWQHPKFGQISPGRFIPVAENTGLIEALGEFVLRRACELGAKAPGRTIAVNISPTQLRNPQFAMQVFDILHQTGMRATDLELEITESILLDDEHVSALNLRTFRTGGIQIALDDFGTGYSSLSYLKRYPVDRIKIDRSFVSQLAEGHVSVSITQAMVTLAHAMDLEVTAEGVETEEQADILSQLGCNTLQGFLFSSGMRGENISRIFADKANAPERRRRISAA